MGLYFVACLDPDVGVRCLSAPKTKRVPDDDIVGVVLGEGVRGLLASNSPRREDQLVLGCRKRQLRLTNLLCRVGLIDLRVKIELVGHNCRLCVGLACAVASHVLVPLEETLQRPLVRLSLTVVFLGELPDEHLQRAKLQLQRRHLLGHLLNRLLFLGSQVFTVKF